MPDKKEEAGLIGPESQVKNEGAQVQRPLMFRQSTSPGRKQVVRPLRLDASNKGVRTSPCKKKKQNGVLLEGGVLE